MGWKDGTRGRRIGRMEGGVGWRDRGRMGWVGWKDGGWRRRKGLREGGVGGLEGWRVG